jgi:outer membrane protein OmpU
MNNLKKIGLTALAGSMVAFSAQALEMSVSGTAKMTFVDEGGSNGNEDVVGNPYGFDQTVAFNGSGESPLGTVSLMHVHSGSAVSSSLLTIDMGDSGKLTLDNGVGVAGAGILKDKLPRASGAEQAWDDTDGDAYYLDTSNAGAWGYNNTFGGISLSVGYAKNGGGFTGDDSNTDAGSDSDKSFAIQYSLMDGMNVGYGYADTDNAASDLGNNTEQTAFVTYAAGPATLGYQVTDIDKEVVGTDTNSTMYGIAVNMNDNASVSYNRRKVELGDDNMTTSDHKDTGIAASYTVGNMTLSAFQNKATDVGGTADKEDEVTQVTVSFAF